MTAWHPRPWILLAIVSAAGFLVNSSAFTTLGVTLPHMVRELGWSWTLAGLGFTVLGGAVGLSSYIPKVLIRRFGVRAALFAGTLCMSAGLFCLSRVEGVALFYLGTALCGAGYQMMTIIPATHVIAAVFRQRALPLGIYFFCFALGSVSGPFIAMGVMDLAGGAWRAVWQVQAMNILLWGSLCAAAIGSASRLEKEAQRTEERPPSPVERETGQTIYRTPTDWTFRDALRTPQFWMLTTAYMTHMLVAISVSSLSVPHLTQRGVATATAAAMLSLEQLVQTCARLLGGLLGDRIDPRWLLMTGLFCLALGPFALAFADNVPTMLVDRI